MKKLSSPFDLIKKTVDLFIKKENLIFLVKIYVPVAIFSVVFLAQSFLPDSIRNSNSIWLALAFVLLEVLYFLVSVFTSLAAIVALGKIIGGEELSLKKTYKKARGNYWLFLLLSVVTALIYVLGFALLIIPGIIFIVWFAFSRFITAEKGLGVKESLLKSKALVKGIYWKILGRLIVIGVFTLAIQVVVSAVPYGIGSILSSLVGGLYILPTYLLYRELSG